jgi:hypothetical protein
MKLSLGHVQILTGSLAHLASEGSESELLPSPNPFLAASTTRHDRPPGSHQALSLGKSPEAL